MHQQAYCLGVYLELIYQIFYKQLFSMRNPIIKQVHDLGQSVWLDNLSRKMLQDGSLEQLIHEVGIYGMTSNPAIFQKAISDSEVYDEAIKECVNEDMSDKDIYERLAVSDIQGVADHFNKVYEETNKEDGYVSLEVAPDLVHDTQGTIDEARRLWKWVDRPNVMIKVPGTEAGLPAITQLLAEGININVTLLFSVERYRAVAEAYIQGLQQRIDSGHAIEDVGSVASFFLSRIDVMVDNMLEQKSKEQGNNTEEVLALRGEAAVANAKIAYEVYEEVFQSDAFRNLESHGARVQRLLWASTSTKNPDYDELKYVHPLIGSPTVNTMPQNTLDSLLEKGKPEDMLKERLPHSHDVINKLMDNGIDIEEVAGRLEDEGVEKFEKPFQQLLNTISEARKALV